MNAPPPTLVSLTKAGSQAQARVTSITVNGMATAYWLRVRSSHTPVRIALDDQADVVCVMGWGDEPREKEDATGDHGVWWFPREPVTAHFDPHGRVRQCTTLPLMRVDEYGVLTLDVDRSREHPDCWIDLPIVHWHKQTPDAMYELFRAQDAAETIRWLRSEWFDISHPSQLWSQWIDARVFDPRTHPGIDCRFACQQCALNHWGLVDRLYADTGNPLYQLMRDLVARMTLDSLPNDGLWRHGFWSHDMESHARFHLDGIHLMLSQASRVDDPSPWLEAAACAATASIEQMTWDDASDTEQSDGELWFLHDSLEGDPHHTAHRTPSIRNQPHSWCINTHVQAMTVLARLAQHQPDEPRWAAALERAERPLRRWLEPKRSPGVHRLLEPALRALMPAGKADGRWRRRISRRVWPALCSIYWHAQRRHPRMVYPSGMTERDLTLSVLSLRYHVINMQDLLCYHGLRPTLWLVPIIRRGVGLLRGVDLERWLKSSPYFIEMPAVLDAYDRLIEPVPDEERRGIERLIEQNRRGRSLEAFGLRLFEEDWQQP